MQPRIKYDFGTKCASNLRNDITPCFSDDFLPKMILVPCYIRRILFMPVVDIVMYKLKLIHVDL